MQEHKRERVTPNQMAQHFENLLLEKQKHWEHQMSNMQKELTTRLQNEQQEKQIITDKLVTLMDEMEDLRKKIGVHEQEPQEELRGRNKDEPYRPMNDPPSMFFESLVAPDHRDEPYRSSRIKAKIKLPEFKIGDSFRTWIKRFTLRLEKMGVEDLDEVMAYMDTCLPPVAAGQMWDIIGSGGDLREVASHLSRIYPGPSKSELLREFARIKQKGNETVETFSIRWYDLRYRMVAMDLTMDDEREVQELLLRVRHSHQISVLDPDSAEEVFRLAANLESHFDGGPSRASRQNSRWDDVEDKHQRQPAAWNRRSRVNVICFNCRGKEHMVRECTRAKNGERIRKNAQRLRHRPNQEATSSDGDDVNTTSGERSRLQCVELGVLKADGSNVQLDFVIDSGAEVFAIIDASFQRRLRVTETTNDIAELAAGNVGSYEVTGTGSILLENGSKMNCIFTRNFVFYALLGIEALKGGSLDMKNNIACLPMLSLGEVPMKSIAKAYARDEPRNNNVIIARRTLQAPKKYNHAASNQPIDYRAGWKKVETGGGSAEQLDLINFLGTGGVNQESVSAQRCATILSTCTERLKPKEEELIEIEDSDRWLIPHINTLLAESDEVAESKDEEYDIQSFDKVRFVPHGFSLRDGIQQDDVEDLIENITKSKDDQIAETKPEDEDMDVLTKEFIELFGHLHLNAAANVSGVVLEMKTDNPVYDPRRHHSKAEEEIIDKEVSTMLQLGIVQRSVSPYNCPLLVVKQASKFRVCFDFRRLNKNLVSMDFPLPRIRDLLERLHGVEWLTALDLARGFHQIPINPNSTKYLAFSTAKGKFEFTRLPFGLKIAPMVFQEKLSRVLENWLHENLILYIDDILVFTSDSKEQHLNIVREVMGELQKQGFRLRREKCVVAAKNNEISRL